MIFGQQYNCADDGIFWNQLDLSPRLPTVFMSYTCTPSLISSKNVCIMGTGYSILCLTIYNMYIQYISLFRIQYLYLISLHKHILLSHLPHITVIIVVEKPRVSVGLADRCWGQPCWQRSISTFWTNFPLLWAMTNERWKRVERHVIWPTSTGQWCYFHYRTKANDLNEESYSQIMADCYTSRLTSTQLLSKPLCWKYATRIYSGNFLLFTMIPFPFRLSCQKQISLF